MDEWKKEMELGRDETNLKMQWKKSVCSLEANFTHGSGNRVTSKVAGNGLNHAKCLQKRDIIFKLIAFSEKN